MCPLSSICSTRSKLVRDNVVSTVNSPVTLEAKFAETLKSLLDSRDASKEHRRAKMIALDEKRLVIDPEHLDPVLSAQDKINKELQTQNLSLRNDVAALSDAVDLLLQDNNKFRGFIEKKNLDLKSLLDTMAENEGEVVINLKRQIGLLNDENKALTFETSALKELRLKDLQRLDQFERFLQEGNRLVTQNAS